MFLLQIEVVGLKFCEVFWPFLCGANMQATNQSSGNTPCNSDWLKMNIRMGAIDDSFQNLWNVLTLILEIKFWIPCLLTPLRLPFQISNVPLACEANNSNQ